MERQWGEANRGHPISTHSTHDQQAIGPPLPSPSGGKRPRAPPKRKKVKIEWIQDDAHRRSTFNKRKNGVVKKAEELHLLCGVETCVVIYGDGESPPEVWPSWDKAAEMCRRFRITPVHEAGPRTMNHVSFTEDRVQKLRKQIARMERELGDLCTRGLLYDGLVGKDLRLDGGVKVALVNMILELSAELRLELAARRQTDVSAPPPPPAMTLPLLPPAWVGPAAQIPPPLSLLQPSPPVTPLPPPQEGLQGPLLSPDVYSPWELTVSGGALLPFVQRRGGG